MNLHKAMRGIQIELARLQGEADNLRAENARLRRQLERVEHLIEVTLLEEVQQVQQKFRKIHAERGGDK